MNQAQEGRADHMAMPMDNRMMGNEVHDLRGKHSAFADQSLNQSGGPQTQSTSQIGHKKSPKFVQINL